MLALCASFIIRGDLIFAQVKEEILSRIRRIQALGSALLGRRLTDLAFELKVAFDVLAEYRANLTHDAHELFERNWADLKREVDALTVSLSEAHISREEASHQVTTLLVFN